MALRNKPPKFPFLDAKHTAVPAVLKQGGMKVSETSLRNAQAFKSLAASSTTVKTSKAAASAAASSLMQKPYKPVIKR